MTGRSAASRSRISSAYVENVVYPPSTPTPRKGRAYRLGGHRVEQQDHQDAERKRSVDVLQERCPGEPVAGPWEHVADTPPAEAAERPPAATTRRMSERDLTWDEKPSPVIRWTLGTLPVQRLPLLVPPIRWNVPLNGSSGSQLRSVIESHEISGSCHRRFIPCRRGQHNGEPGGRGLPPEERCSPIQRGFA